MYAVVVITPDIQPPIYMEEFNVDSVAIFEDANAASRQAMSLAQGSTMSIGKEIHVVKVSV